MKQAESILHAESRTLPDITQTSPLRRSADPSLSLSHSTESTRMARPAAPNLALKPLRVRSSHRLWHALVIKTVPTGRPGLLIHFEGVSLFVSSTSQVMLTAPIAEHQPACAVASVSPKGVSRPLSLSSRYSYSVYSSRKSSDDDDTSSLAQRPLDPAAFLSERHSMERRASNTSTMSTMELFDTIREPRDDYERPSVLQVLCGDAMATT